MSSSTGPVRMAAPIQPAGLLSGGEVSTTQKNSGALRMGLLV